MSKAIHRAGVWNVGAAEQARRDAEWNFWISARHAGFILAQCDRKLRYTWVYNPHPDFNPCQLLGRRDDEIERSEGTRHLVAMKQRVLDTGTGVRKEIEFQRSDGSQIYDIMAEAIRDASGAIVGVRTAAFNITAHSQSDAALQHQLVLEQLLAAASSRLVNVSMADLDATIHEVLADVGRFLGADRSHLCSISSDLSVVDNTHEWCAPGIHPMIASLKNSPASKFRWMLKRLNSGHPLCIQRLSDIPATAKEERRILQKGHVRSAVLVPIRHGGRLTGFIGCDAVRDERRWSDANVRLLRILGEDLANALARCRTDEALRTMAEELEQRVKARTAALRETTERLQATLTAANAVAWELDPASDTLLESGPVAEFFERPKKFRHGTHTAFLQSVHPDDRPHVRAQLERALQSPRTDYAAEFRLLLPNGAIRWVATSGSIERDGHHRPTRLRGILRDITARKQAELALARTNRALGVITEGDRTLVWATSEQSLLDALCRMVVEVGGYRMAWVGYAEQGDDEPLRLMAMAGFTKVRPPIPAQARIKCRRCLATEAVYRRKPRVCRDISRDPAFAPFRKEALKRGCVSALALPLLMELRCLGALVICSAQPDAFDDAEVQLFQQLANDISFGIMALRGREERKELERRVLDIDEREQRRLGQDLHDGLGQDLIGINYLLSALQRSLSASSAPAAAELERIRQLLGKTMQQVRETAQGLFPEELRRGGIADALQQLASHAQNMFGIPCRLTGSTGVELADADVASQVYRIAQEAVNNAARHSKSKTIEIRLSQQRGHITLTVRDEGIGLPRPAGQPGGMGQRIMKYRADIIGATLNIESARGKGTSVTCRLPLPIRPKKRS